MTLAERLEAEGVTAELVGEVAELERFAARCRVMNAHVAAFVFSTHELMAEDLVAYADRQNANTDG